MEVARSVLCLLYPRCSTAIICGRVSIATQGIASRRESFKPSSGSLVRLIGILTLSLKNRASFIRDCRDRSVSSPSLDVEHHRSGGWESAICDLHSTYYYLVREKDWSERIVAHDLCSAGRLLRAP
ncbi:hypothetical protein BJY04DRAFT_38189 [Aspergillus karnatakaensis]|uniref:uncharacterized protein n=1 Tax=Aspergillus karnatakaensis TaxID=1810916 RepID=UPI003CCD1814